MRHIQRALDGYLMQRALEKCYARANELNYM